MTCTAPPPDLCTLHEGSGIGIDKNINLSTLQVLRHVQGPVTPSSDLLRPWLRVSDSVVPVLQHPQVQPSCRLCIIQMHQETYHVQARTACVDYY